MYKNFVCIQSYYYISTIQFCFQFLSHLFVVLCFHFFNHFISTLFLIPSLVTDNPFLCNFYHLPSPSLCFFIMLFLSIRLVMFSRYLFNCFTSAFILFLRHCYIPVFSLFLASYISLTTTAATYTKSFSSVIFSSGLQ